MTSMEEARGLMALGLKSLNCTPQRLFIALSLSTHRSGIEEFWERAVSATFQITKEGERL